MSVISKTKERERVSKLSSEAFSQRLARTRCGSPILGGIFGGSQKIRLSLRGLAFVPTELREIAALLEKIETRCLSTEQL